MTVRVLLADDDALLRAGIEVVLGAADGIEVVGEAADGLQAFDRCRSLAPDVVLMDVRMPGVDGIEATRRIVAAGLPTRVLVLSTFRHDEYVWGALRAGDFALVVLDVGLPDLDGKDVARRIRAQVDKRDMLLIALTGYDSAEDQRLALEAGFDIHLVKPVTSSALQRILEGLVQPGDER